MARGGVRLWLVALVLGGAAAPLLMAGPASAATGSYSYVLRGDVVGEVFDPADEDCVPFDDTIMKIVNDTDRTLRLARSCAGGAETAGLVKPGQTHTPAPGAPPAYAVVPLRPDDPRNAPPPKPPAEEEQPRSPLPEISLF